MHGRVENTVTGLTHALALIYAWTSREYLHQYMHGLVDLHQYMHGRVENAYIAGIELHQYIEWHHRIASI